MPGYGDGRGRVAGSAQSIFREVNERIIEVGDGRATELVCECCRWECVEPVMVSLGDYDEVRSSSVRFIVKPGHLDPSFERLVVERDGFVIIEKFGEAGQEARRMDAPQAPEEAA